MTQTKTIILAVIGVAVIIGGYFIIKSNTSPSVGDEVVVTQTELETAAPEATGKKMAFSQFVKQGGSYQCTVHQYIGDMDTMGTTYIHNGMIRGEHTTEIQGMTIDTTLIVRDGYSYTWTSLAPNMGFKAKVTDMTNTDTSVQTSGTYSFNADQIGDYNCESWKEDVSVFEIPSGVTFQEIS
jgi:hypothetical protein